MTKKNLKRLAAPLLTLAFLGAVAAAMICYSFNSKAIEREINIKITSSTTYDDVVGAIKPSLRLGLHRLAFNFYAERLDLKRRYRTGNYTFGEDEDIIRIVRKLVLGEQTPVNIVVSEARTLPQLAGKLASQIEADSVEILSTMRNEQIRKELGFVKDSTIAMFIPNTYEVYWNISPEKLLHRINREYRSFWNEERTTKLKRCGLSKYEAITLASIIYEETKVASEMATIAGVYINRLRQGIPLGADPTVKYAIGDFGLKRVLHKHLKYRSPFNTYIKKGLPPAPICIPSVEAIEAVLEYEEHDYIYFCARPELDGRHNFARTLKEHNANARKYSEALERLKIK